MAAALLNFLFKKKECKTEQQKSQVREPVQQEISQDTRLLYLTAEFKCLGDLIQDNRLRLGEFIRLMLLLGYQSDEEELEKLWNSIGQSDGSFITLDEYLALMSNEEISSKTDTWRKLFAKFDTDGNGFASRQEVLHGLEQIGLDITPNLRDKVAAMDGDEDGKISYCDFLKVQLSQE